MSDTPRTDAVKTNAGYQPFETKVVPLDFARQLERELNELQSAMTVARLELDNCMAHMEVHGVLRRDCVHMTVLELCKQLTATQQENERLRQLYGGSGTCYESRTIPIDYAELQVKLANAHADAERLACHLREHATRSYRIQEVIDAHDALVKGQV